MAAGIPITRSEIDQTAGSIARGVFASMQNVAQFKTWLDSISVAQLQSLYGYTENEANELKSAYADAGKLVQVFEGLVTVSPVQDFRVFLRRLIGVGIY